MKRKLLAASFILLAILSLPLSAFAQDLPYLFEVDKETVHAYWNGDGTLDLDYTWTFTNLPGSHPIDFVDVGTVNSTFDLSNVRADVDGTPVSVSWDDYMGNGSGFAIVMGNKTIRAGTSGTVHVFIPDIRSVLYPDKDDAYASASFAPTWFGSQYVSGTTDFTMTFHLPPNMNPEEPRWHEAPEGFPVEPQTGFDEEGRITYTWYSPAANASKFYNFGASFPRTYVPADTIYTPPLRPLIDPETFFILICLGGFGFIFIGLPILGVRAANRRKLQYLPPKISIEGHGIKRGLTAVEAALLMEQPLDKVMTMILFGAIKKNAATVVKRDPLELNVPDSFMKNDNLRDYEKNFLRAFVETDKKKRRSELQNMTVALVKSVSEKMKGFSRRETVDYYKSIMEKAWAQVEAADTPEVQSRMFDEALEWTMLDKDYDDRTRRTFTRPIIVPTWWGRYDPSWRGSGSTSTPVSVPSSSGGGSTSTGLPGADFAASMVTGVQGFATGVIGNVQEFTGKITGVTNPPPPPSKSSGGRSGGGGRSCACACACAGCACACAGGGR